MEHFSVGEISYTFVVLFPVLYLLGFQLRRLAAWSMREEGPKGRVAFFITLSAIFGFVVGSLAQPLWSKASECKAQGQPVISCTLFQNK